MKIIQVAIFCILSLVSVSLYGRQYSEVSSESSLPEDFSKRVTNIQHLKRNKTYKKLIKHKHLHMAKHATFFAYSSESVDDTSWGCAWRAIQTTLSPFYHKKNSDVPEFKELYKMYCTRDFIETQYKLVYPEHYSKNDDSWKAPENDWHMWADPFVGKMILSSLKVDTKLFAINRAPEIMSPAANDGTITFKTFKRMLRKYFQKGGYPIVIDNGKFALNILGAGFSKSGTTYLLMGDPHLLFERQADPLNGIYTVELDETGKQIARDYPKEKEHFYDNENGYSYEKVSFEEGTSWLILIKQ